MKKIFLHGKLGSGKFVMVDDEDWQRVWVAKPYMGTKYPYVTVGGRPVALHNFVYGITADELKVLGMVIDHVDRNKLDVTRKNLEMKTVSENNKNRRSWSKKHEQD